MPNSTWPSGRDVPLISDASLAALLTGAELPPGAAPQLRPLAETLAKLAARPTEDELDGEADTLTAFRDHFGAAGPAQHAGRGHGPQLHSRRLPLRVAAAVATILGLGGLATVAYAGALPTGLQRLAHDVIGAPAAGAQPATNPSPAIPAATRQPGYGLCAAWAKAKAHGTRKQQAVAFDKLAAAAGGPGNAAAYCTVAARMAPPPSSRPRPAPTPPHRSGRPTVLPAPHGSGKPTALPTPHGSGKPSTLPTPHNPGGATVHLTQRLATKDCYGRAGLAACWP
jgi:hypothetical protein